MSFSVKNNGTSYVGVLAPTPPNFVSFPKDPNPNNINFRVGDFWLNEVSRDLWRLAGFDATSAGKFADWVIVGGATGDVITLTGNTGGAVPSDGAGNINVVGDGTTVTVAGNAGTNTLTISLVGGGVAADEFVTGPGVSTVSGGTAVPDGTGSINILGAHNVDTGAAVANTVTVFGTNTITVGDLAAVPVNNDSITMTTGDLRLLEGNIRLPETNVAENRSIIYQGISSFIHTYPDNSNSNFVGRNAGNLGVATGLRNSGFGWQTLSDLTTGDDNCAQGQSALSDLTTGSNNTAIGSRSLVLLTTGSGNTAIGEETGYNTGAGTGVVDGANNVLVGLNAGTNYTGSESNNVIVGAQVGGTVGESNKTRIGLFGTTNQAFIAGAEQTLPSGGSPLYVDTSTGQIGLSGSGVGTVAFSARSNVAQNNITGAGAVYTVLFGSVTYNVGAGYDGVSTFTAPSTGLYLLSAAVVLNNITAAMTQGFVTIVTTPNAYELLNCDVASLRGKSFNTVTISGAIQVRLTAGDTAFVRTSVINGAGNTISIPGTGISTYFAGHLLST